MPPFLLFTPTRQAVVKKAAPNAPKKPKQLQREQVTSSGVLDYREFYVPEMEKCSSLLSKQIGKGYKKYDFCTTKKNVICHCDNCKILRNNNLRGKLNVFL